MSKRIVSFVRRVLLDRRGQALPWVALGMFGFLGAAGLTVDMGHTLVVYNQLRSSTGAAALAAAGSIYNAASSSNSASSVGNQFSSATGGKNVYPGLTLSNTPTVSLICLNSLMPKGTTCPATNPSPNAVRVTQTANAPTYFLKALGIKSIPLSTTATASMQGIVNPWNVAIIIDATQSMTNAPDSNCSGYSTRFQCAMGGVQSLLKLTNPCPPGQSSCTAADAYFRVSLFSFPNITSSGFSTANPCAGPFTVETYTLPSSTATSYTPTSSSGGTYQITAYSSDYYQPTATYGLNTSSNLVKAVGYGSTAPCLPDVGGKGTYYAGALYAAQASLLAEQKQYGGQNAIILLSDGEANDTVGNLNTGSNSNYSATSGLYPSIVDQCQQAIMAAHYAATYPGNNTRVYAVAYGSTSSGCVTGSNYSDKTLVATGTYNVPVSLSTLSPCVTMEDIASSLSYFFADSSSASSACTDSAHSTTSLSSIFSAISSSFTNPRLISNSAT